MRENNFISQKIKELREHKNLTQKEFADIIGISRNTMANIEGGYQKATLDILTLVVKKFELDANIFFRQSNAEIQNIVSDFKEEYKNSEQSSMDLYRDLLYLKKLIEEKDKLIEEKERLIKILMEKK